MATSPRTTSWSTSTPERSAVPPDRSSSSRVADQRPRPRFRSVRPAPRAPWPAHDTDSRQGRSIEVNPDEELQAPARAAQWTEAFRDRSASCPGPNVTPPKSSTATPSCPGEVWSKADAWVKLRVSAINLDRLDRLGLVGA